MLFDLLTERQQPSDLNLGMAGRQALKGEQQTSTLNNNKLLLSQHKKLFTIPFYHLCKLLASKKSCLIKSLKTYI
jgi:hypothetical protein